MKISLPGWGRAAIAIAAGAGAVALAAGLPAVASASSSGPTGAVVVSCDGQAQVQPHSFILACADDGIYLAGLRWASWSSGPGGAAVAFGRGTDHENDCIPDCARGHFHAYPALITLWRAQARPGHPGQRYFTRLTAIFTGKRPTRYGAHGHKYYPQTFTWELGPQAG
jgi:hypothetical protein